MSSRLRRIIINLFVDCGETRHGLVVGQPQGGAGVGALDLSGEEESSEIRQAAESADAGAPELSSREETQTLYL